MNNRIYVSTGAFQSRNLYEILNLCSAYDISALELGANLDYETSILPKLIQLAESGEFSFLIHNYFPAPAEAFVLNLAALDKQLLEKNRLFCMNAIKIGAKLRSPFYSVHAGYCFHALPEHLGRDISRLVPTSMEESEAVFVDSVRILADYAKSLNMSVLIENNVLAPFNLIYGENKLLLGVTQKDLMRLINRIKKENVGILLDVGHLYVSSKSLDFSPVAFISEIVSFIKCVHLSDNDGSSDTNKTVSESSWFWEPLRAMCEEETVLILEANNLPAEAIRAQLDLISSKFS